MSAETASPTVDDDENLALIEALGLSPNRFCSLYGHSVAIDGDKVYAYDGTYKGIKPSSDNKTESRYYKNDKLIVFDHSEPIEYGNHKVSTIKKPPFVDNLMMSSILQPNSSSRKFYAYGGRRGYSKNSEDPNYIAPNPQGDPKGRIFTYDFATQEWGRKIVDVAQLVNAQSTNDPLRGVSYVLDGIKEQDYDDSIDDSIRIMGKYPKIMLHKGLLEFDPIDLSFRNISNSNNAYDGLKVDGYLEYLPFGNSGVLISWGGYRFPFHRDGEKPERDSMTEVDIYDIASNTWFKQQTYTQFLRNRIVENASFLNEAHSPKLQNYACSVVKPAPDLSSYNIYMVGGENQNDGWVLSIPSFTWIKLWESTDSYLFDNSECVEYGNYLIFVGGYSSRETECKGILKWLDLSTGEMVTKWKGKAAKEDAYTIPEAVYSIIGGNGNGGAKVRKPPKSWSSSELANIFSQTPDSEAMANWRSNPSTNSGSSKTSTSKTDSPSNLSSGNSSKVPTAAIAGGIVGGLTVIAIIIFLVYFIRKRRRQNPRRINSALDEHQTHYEIDGRLRKRDEMVYQEMEGASNIRHELQSSKHIPAAAMVQGDWNPSELAGVEESGKWAQITHTPERVVYELDAREISPRPPSPRVK